MTDDQMPPFNRELLDLLVCPESKAPLLYDQEHNELRCDRSGLAYPIRDGIPILLVSEARAYKDSGDQEIR